MYNSKDLFALTLKSLVSYKVKCVNNQLIHQCNTFIILDLNMKCFRHVPNNRCTSHNGDTHFVGRIEFAENRD